MTKRKDPISKLTILGTYSRLVGRTFALDPTEIGNNFDLFCDSDTFMTLRHDAESFSIPTPEAEPDKWKAIDSFASSELGADIVTVFDDGISSIRLKPVM